MTRQLTDALRAPITTLADGERFVRALVDQGLAFHFEDGAADCLAGSGLVSDADAAIIDHQVLALYRLAWGKAQCPIGFMLHVLAERDEAAAGCLLPDDWREI